MKSQMFCRCARALVRYSYGITVPHINEFLLRHRRSNQNWPHFGIWILDALKSKTEYVKKWKKEFQEDRRNEFRR